MPEPPPPAAAAAPPPPVPTPAPAPAPVAAAPAPLVELDAPSETAAAAAPIDLLPPNVARPAPGSAGDAAQPGSSRSTMEFLFELDLPGGPTSSREIDLTSLESLERTTLPGEGDAAPFEVHAELSEEEAVASEATEAPAYEPFPRDAGIPDEASDELPAPSIPARLERIALPSTAAANTAEEQLDQRRRRVVLRLLTCRDAFRVLGFLGIQDNDRREAARMMMELDSAVTSSAGESVAKDPLRALANADKDELDQVDRLVAPIEDRLLALDDALVADAAIARLESANKLTAKALARYGRLLASRRFQAGPRRDRFEWVATRLLTRRRRDGFRELLSAERAAQALEVMIGGLPYKVKEQELTEALAYLTDALQRLDAFSDHDAFFDSEYFLDVHGYKVSMRDQLLHPDFLYVSVAINAKLHNRVEEWSRSLERLHRANQLTQEGTPREKIARALREQEEAVAKIFGVKAKAPVAALAPRTEVKKPEPKKAKRAKKKRSFSFAMPELDRTAVKFFSALILAIAATAYVLLDTGVIQTSSVERVQGDALTQISPALVRGTVHGSGSNRMFEGVIRRPDWRKLAGEARKQEAEKIAQGLSAVGVQKAKVLTDRTVVIEIEHGLVTSVDVSDAP